MSIPKPQHADRPRHGHYPLWFRFKGTPLDRPGGAWWCEVFPTDIQRANFIELVGPFMEEHAKTAQEYRWKVANAKRK